MNCFVRRYWIVAVICAFSFLLCSKVLFATITSLEVRAFPLKGQTENLQPEILDFRYSPARWQACIGLPDDPHKSIVGSDGGLYYQYGGGEFYRFRTRVLASVETDGQKSMIQQRLWNSRIPIVITEQKFGDLLLRQEAWAGAVQQKNVSDWSPQRVDYLWLRLSNTGSQPQTGQVVVRIDSAKSLVLNNNKTRILKKNLSQTFGVISPSVCSSWSSGEGKTESDDSEIDSDPTPGTIKGWANPDVTYDKRFRDIMVGYGRPLTFTYPVEKKQKLRVAFALIEGWHNQPGSRPLEIRLEGEVVRHVDMIAEHGKDIPAVYIFDADDKNGNGLLEMGVYFPPDTTDKNTVLSGLWIFDAKDAPTASEILAGKSNARARAVAFPENLGGKILKLQFDKKRLSPGQEYQVLIAFYQGEKASIQRSVAQAKMERDRAIRYWQNADLPYDRMTVPDQILQSLLDSCIRNIYQAREIKNGQKRFQVGPTCYRGTWAVDGAFISEAVAYLGRANESRNGIEAQINKDEGPGGITFSKKAGIRLWTIWRHGQLTGDRIWLEKFWPIVEREVNRIIEYRKMTTEDTNQPNYGLMPPGTGDGGLGGVHREYTNVYWTLAGLKAAIEMTEQMQKKELQQTWQNEYHDYWQTFDKARNRDKLTDKAGNVYVPVTMKGEKEQLPQRGAWAFMHSIFPGRIFSNDDELMLGTMAMLDATEREGLIYGTGWLIDGVWNYAASFYGHAHLWLGHGRKTAATLYAFGNHACPLLCWREEQNLVGEKGEICGDMPHNWASAEFIRMVRHMMILERGNQLHLMEGLPASWTKPGDKTRMYRIPTSFGTMSLSLTMAKDGKSATIKVDPPHREPLDKIVVHLEHFDRPIKAVRLGPKKITDTTIRIQTDKGFTLNVEF